MRTCGIRAYAKINMTLDVTGIRDDGYHDLCMIMQSVGLYDEIDVITGTGKPDCAFSNLTFLPRDGKNIALLAAQRFFETAGSGPDGIEVRIRKNIPVCAGLGGGSADAAAVLKALTNAYPEKLSKEVLLDIALSLGSDVPFCLSGGTALVSGKGELIKRLPDIPFCHILLCKPRFSVSTRVMFREIDKVKLNRRPDTQGAVQTIQTGDLCGLAHRLYNVFEDIVAADHREIHDIRHTMLDGGAVGAAMSGSGPTMFGLFSSKDDAQKTYNALKKCYPDTFLTHTRTDV